MSERMLGEKFKPGGNRPRPQMSPEGEFFSDAEISHTFTPADLGTVMQKEASAPHSDTSRRMEEKTQKAEAREFAEINVHEAEIAQVLADLKALKITIEGEIAEAEQSLAEIRKAKQKKAVAAGIGEHTYPASIAEA